MSNWPQSWSEAHRRLRGPAIASALSVGVLLAAAGSQADDLRQAVTAYVERNPSASLIDVASFAEARREELGVPYDFELRADATEVVLEAEDRRLTVPVREIGPCSERWVSLPVLHVSRQAIELVQENRVITVHRPRELRLNTHRILAPDGLTTTATIEVPWPTTPSRVAADGRALYIRFHLLHEGNQWWSNVRARHAQITDAHPYLVLTISADGSISFVGDPAFYTDEPIDELEESSAEASPFHRRWRFRHSGFIVDFEIACT